MGTLEQNQYFVKVEQGQIVTQMQPIKENLLRISRLLTACTIKYLVRRTIVRWPCLDALVSHNRLRICKVHSFYVDVCTFWIVFMYCMIKRLLTFFTIQ